jgi:predicted glycogen debranching enzyme
MSFDIRSWLVSQVGEYEPGIPLVDVSEKRADDEREWLITNGLGSYASASIWGANTRRYHGLLVVALEPPVARHVLLSRIDEVLDGQQLSTNHWTSGAVSPEGYKLLESFTIYPIPTWVFAVAGGYLVKQVAMTEGKQEVVVGYTWIGDKTAHLSLSLLVNFRDFHSQTKGSLGWVFPQRVETGRVRVRAYDSAPELVIAFSRGAYQVDPSWYWNYYWPREHERGLEFREDNYRAGLLEVNLEPGSSVTLRAGLDSGLKAGTIQEAVRSAAVRHNALVARAGKQQCEDVKRLVLSTDSFIVERRSTSGHSIIAGYHWFNDWGRDSMISLPGLALCTGRPEIARGILKTFGHYLSQGMLPNNFPDSGMTPAYNTSDAAFWWAWALLRYHDATGDSEFIASQLPLLESVVDWHRKGTRYGLHMDESNGLISGGQPGVQLTWMDAKVGDYVVTPRHGKAVEINALWYNFLRTLAHMLRTTGGEAGEYDVLADKVREGFRSFWNTDARCLFDVLRDDGTADASIRPNQILALSLPFPLLEGDRARSVLAVVERELLTPFGLRTLAPSDHAYQGRYGADRTVANQYERDITYHQGTAWAWLLGPWVDARMKVYGRAAENVGFIAERLKPIRDHILGSAGLGSVSEIFDGDAPHHPCGCIAQAWSVAELLRILTDYPELQ